jgi:hypothetical protein
MKTIIRAFRRTKKLLTGVAAVGLLAGAIGFALPVGSASAYTCRVQSATSAGSEAGWVYSSSYHVPNTSVSACKDINVRNIQNQLVASDHCATFKVQFFPTWGQPYYGTAKYVCSNGSNGPIVPIATNVLDGTKYRIWYSLEGSFQAHTYQIID